MSKLPAAAQEEHRRQVIGLRQRGLSYGEIAEQVGLSRTGVINICQRFAAEGIKDLVSKSRGRKPDGSAHAPNRCWTQRRKSESMAKSGARPRTF
jgi:transposase